MAFCTKCGSKVDDNSRFCTSCGTTLTPAGIPPAAGTGMSAAPASVNPAAPGASPVVVAPTAAPAAAGGGSSALKIVLIIIAVFVGLGFLGLATCGYTAWRLHNAVKVHTESDGQHTSVELPGMKINANEGDASKAAADMGVQVYPGASPRKGSSGTVSFGGMNIGGADFETSDSVDKVADWYHEKYPNANVTSRQENRAGMMIMSDKGWITVSIEGMSNGNTKISLARMSGLPVQK